MSFEVNSVRVQRLIPVYERSEGGVTMSGLSIEMSYKINTNVNGHVESHSHTITPDLWSLFTPGLKNQFTNVLDAVLDHLESELEMT